MSNKEIKEILGAAYKLTEQKRFAEAIVELEDGLRQYGANGQFLKALGITHQKQGDMNAAIAAIDRLVELEKDNIRAWVMKGAFHEKVEQKREALQAYHCALALNDQTPSNNQAEITEVRKRIPMIMGQIEGHINSQLEQAGLARDTSDRRFNNALDIMFGRKQIYFQEPHHLYFPELPHKQFYKRKEFNWVEELESQLSDIRAELEVLLSEDSKFTPYLQSEAHIPGSENTALANSMDWSSFYLIKDGDDVLDNQALCPVTTAALNKVNLCRTGGGTPSVLFSRLKPGAHIPPHTGMLNMRLICHLPIIVPGEARLRVGNEFHEWEEGRVVIFDDTIEHEAWNHADKDRFVLLFDIWRPEITERERKLLDIVLSAR